MQLRRAKKRGCKEADYLKLFFCPAIKKVGLFNVRKRVSPPVVRYDDWNENKMWWRIYSGRKGQQLARREGKGTNTAIRQTWPRGNGEFQIQQSGRRKGFDRRKRSKTRGSKKQETERLQKERKHVPIGNSKTKQ